MLPVGSRYTIVPDVCCDEQRHLLLYHHAGEAPGLANIHILTVQALHCHPVPLLYYHVDVALHTEIKEKITCSNSLSNEILVVGRSPIKQFMLGNSQKLTNWL